MITFLNNIKRYLNKVLGLFPSALPNGMAEFESWSLSISSTYNLPAVSAEDIKFVLSTTIMHLGPTAAFKPKFYFVLVLRAAAAKQVASATFQQIKAAQKAAAEATVIPAVASDVASH